MGPPRLPQHLDRGLFLARDRAGLVVLYARSHIRPPVPDIARRKLCSLQFPDDLLGRFHSSLAARAAVPLLALGRVSAARPSQQATADPERAWLASFVSQRAAAPTVRVRSSAINLTGRAEPRRP